MNFAILQKAMQKKNKEEDSFSASEYIQDIGDKFKWVNTYFFDHPDKTLDIATEMFNDCNFEETEISLDVLDILNSIGE